MQKLYEAEVIADSISDRGIRLTSILVTMPRFVLAELNTHRVFSRNSASSRAIPVERRIEMIRDDPVVPEAFTKNRRGMQATETLDEEADAEARDIWLDACGYCCAAAKSLADRGVHKQHANRLIEPWSPHTALVTATEWDNFWALRISPNAQPEIKRAAEAMKAVFDASQPLLVKPDGDQLDWHFPFDDGAYQYAEQHPDGKDDWNSRASIMAKVCIGRCARLSCLTHDGKRDPGQDVELADRLLAMGHMSPFEHVARPMTDAEWVAYSASYQLARHLGPDGRPRPGNLPLLDPSGYLDCTEYAFCGNFNGWIQYRKLIPGESVYTGE